MYLTKYGKAPDDVTKFKEQLTTFAISPILDV